MAITPTSLSHLNPFRTETISFGKIAWISREKAQDFKIAAVPAVLDEESSYVVSTDMTFVPYELKTQASHRYSSRAHTKHENFLKLIQAVAAVKEATRYDAFEDYQTASTHLRDEFSYAMNETPSTPASEVIAMTSSSAEMMTAPVGTVAPGSPVTSTTAVSTTPPTAAVVDSSGRILGGLPEVAAAPNLDSDGKSYEEQAALADLETPTDPLSKAAENLSRGHGADGTAGETFISARTSDSTPEETATSKTSAAPIQDQANGVIAATSRAMVATPIVPSAPPAKKLAKNQNVDIEPGDVSNDEVPLVTVDSQNAGIMAVLLNSQKLNSQPTQVASNSVAPSSHASTNAPIASIPMNTTPANAKLARADEVPLSSAEQKDLADALLSTQLTTAAMNKQNSIAANGKADSIAPLNPKITNDIEEEPESPVEATHLAAKVATPSLESKVTDPNACGGVATQKFIKAGGASNSDVAIQVCPTNLTWLSKSSESSAWLKVEGEDYFPTLTLEPAPNNGSTLLLDTNALGLLSIKSGVHVTKGMGIILGIVPDGYKVNFTGRAEETEYFASTGNNYFAILNAEPGAGVVEVESKTNPNISSTVFAPVIGDTITYLDLAAPYARNLKIKVVKNGGANDPEVSKLTVGLSTQTGLQAITRADGQATLKNVSLVPGFPVFVDVGSRNDETDSFTYRYQIKHPESGGVFVANEVDEKSIHHWLSQVKQGLSDQSAMVIGLYDRQKLNGFKSIHYSDVEALTAKYGLEPMSYSVLWNGVISSTDPLEGDLPRFMGVQVPEGLSNVKLLNETREVESSELFPISPRVIHVISN